MARADDDLATLRAFFRDRDDVRLALVFGSVARAQAGAGSDLDIAVRAPGCDLLALAGALSIATSREVDVVALDDVEIPLLEELVKDAVVVHEHARGAAARWRFHAQLELETDGPWYRRMRDAFIQRLARSRDATGA